MRLMEPVSGAAVPKRPTVTDLARAAGVSVATVDRVLNQRLPVREATAQAVLKAAETLDYHAAPLLRRRAQADLPARTLGFALQKRTDQFYQMLAAELVAATEAAPAIRGRALVQFMEELSPAASVRSLRELGRRVDALAIVAVDHPHIAEEIAALRGRGVPTFTLLTDLTAEHRAGYIGLDGRKAGRTAAWTIARTSRQPGQVGIMLGSHRYLGHEWCESGFRSYFREHGPAFHVLEAMVNLEDPRVAYEATIDLLAHDRNLAGLYVAGGGVEGVCRALREERRGGTVAFVCNELTADTRAGLIDGVVTMVIGTPRAALAARAVEVMARALIQGGTEPPTQTLLPFDIFVSENI